MKTIRLLAAVIFLMVAMSLNSFGYEVLCQSLPTSLTVTDVITPIFTCAIPANAAATGKSLRLTSNLHLGSTGELVGGIYLSGSDFANGFATSEGQEMNFSIIITNTGGTGCRAAGTVIGNSSFAVGPGTGSGLTVPWSSGWNLQVKVDVSSGSVIADGDTFVVEILA
jgi:hypothetical protein